MNSDASDARLAHAKKLLTKFQNRQRTMNELLDVELVGASTCEPNGSPQAASVETPSMEQSLHSSRSSSFVNIDQTGYLNDQNGLHSATPEVCSLRQALAEKEHHLNSTMTKLQALHGHYAELYKTFNELRTKQSDSSEFSQQIGQLQTALAISVAEKTQLQSELRSVAGHQKALEVEIEFLRSQNNGSMSATQLLSHQAENQKLSETVANQSATIAQQRADCADLEAKIVVLNQDKNDIQARLKYVYQEKDEIATRLNELKNELNIKEIYIRQLAKHSSVDSAQGQQTIQTLTEQKNFFETECQRYSHDIAIMKSEFDTSKRRYEECLEQSRVHASTLEQTIEQLTAQKRQLEFSKFCLEEELQLLRKNAQENLIKATEQNEEPTAKDSTVETRPEHSEFDYDALHNSYQKMEIEFQRQTVLIGQLNAAMEEKDFLNTSLNSQVEEQEHKIQRLEAQIKHFQQIGSDVQTLSTQLQNERATVSRAVSQNMELKEQFGEMQDKLIKLTNDYAQSEDQKMNALALVARLSKKIEDMESNYGLKLPSNEGSTQTDITATSQQDATPEHQNQNPTDRSGVQTEISSNELSYSHRIRDVQSANYPNAQIGDSKLRHDYSTEPRRNESQSGESYNPSESASTTPDTVDISTLQQSHETEDPDENGLTEPLSENDDPEEQEAVQDFLSSPKSSDTPFMRHLRNTFYKLNTTASKLHDRVQVLERQTEEYKQANDRLQYWLTSVESENESIVDFIELYRMQRAGIQARITEKEEECIELRKIRDLLESRIKLLHTSLLTFLRKSQHMSDIVDEVTEVAGESNENASNCVIHDLMRQLIQMKNDQHSTNDEHLNQLAQSLQEATLHFDPNLHCSECRGEMYNL